MPKNDFDTAWEESRQARRSWTRPDVYLTLLLGSAVGLAVGVMLGAGWFADEGYWTNVYTEALSIVLTVVVIGVINEWRETERRKRDLIRRAGSRSNEIAKDAVDEMRHEGWLTGENGLLRDVN